LEYLHETKAGLDWRRSGKESKQWFFHADAPVLISPSLDDHTALAFELADAFLRELMPPETIVALKPFVKEAGKRLANRRQIAAAKWKDKIHVFPIGLRKKAPRILPEVRDVVYQALLDDRAIRIVHLSRGQSAPVARVISPLGLVVRGYVVYLYGLPKEQYEKPEKRVLSFALHRTRSAEMLVNEPFLRPEGFLLAAYEDVLSMPRKDEQKVIDLVLRIGENSTISMRECPLVGRQTLEQDSAFPGKKRCILRAQVPNTEELRQWIRSLGPNAEVLEPAQLRLEIAAEVRELASRYHQ
jgi:predicted DNA-binding transcriptional regulator YafY